MKFILGKKIGMTQVFKDTGEVVPVTKIVAGPCQVVQVKDGANGTQKALQLGIGPVKEYLVKKPQAGHLAGLELVRTLRDFAFDKPETITRGDIVKCDTFNVGDIVNVIGVSKGKGFAGVVKRHHFHGAPKTHGHKHDLRAPGSLGAGGVQRVFKGMRMGGRMGGDQVTVKNLEVIAVHSETNEIFLKGAVPGGRNGLVMITGVGELKVTKKEMPVAPEAKTETASA